MTDKPIPVEIVEVRSRPTVLTLADGAELHVQLAIHGVCRVPNHFTADGAPVYQFRSVPQADVVLNPADMQVRREIKA